jgi:hypothetical protein
VELGAATTRDLRSGRLIGTPCGLGRMHTTHSVEAAQRNDRCLAPPRGFKGVVALKAVERLLGAGYVREVKGKAGAAVWRRDEIAGQDFCLKLTPSGSRAIAGDSDDDKKPDAAARPGPNFTPEVAPAPMVVAKALSAAG